ncbi:MAG: dihydroxyacetone kinase subunit L [Chloroflexi bacterium]|nr:dihydroxyacetone kinase subunit L [Chloroflexota bacterium]
MTESIQGQAVAEAIKRACAALSEQTEYLTSLDQAMGDGDMGITLSRIADALQSYAEDTPADDLGKFLLGAGMATNRAAPSTIGTLTATALMRMGKVAKGKDSLSAGDIGELFEAADTGIQQRGKAKLGDKTIVDAIHPASVAFAEAIAVGASLQQAGESALLAAAQGRDNVTPLRSKIGRASWVGERTEGLVDPGCAAFVIMLSAIVKPMSA